MIRLHTPDGTVRERCFGVHLDPKFQKISCLDLLRVFLARYCGEISTRCSHFLNSHRSSYMTLVAGSVVFAGKACAH